MPMRKSVPPGCITECHTGFPYHHLAFYHTKSDALHFHVSQRTLYSCEALHDHSYLIQRRHSFYYRPDAPFASRQTRLVALSTMAGLSSTYPVQVRLPPASCYQGRTTFLSPIFIETRLFGNCSPPASAPCARLPVRVRLPPAACYKGQSGLPEATRSGSNPHCNHFSTASLHSSTCSSPKTISTSVGSVLSTSASSDPQPPSLETQAFELLDAFNLCKETGEQVADGSTPVNRGADFLVIQPRYIYYFRCKHCNGTTHRTAHCPENNPETDTKAGKSREEQAHVKYEVARDKDDKIFQLSESRVACRRVPEQALTKPSLLETANPQLIWPVLQPLNAVSMSCEAPASLLPANPARMTTLDRHQSDSTLQKHQQIRASKMLSPAKFKEFLSDLKADRIAFGNGPNPGPSLDRTKTMNSIAGGTVSDMHDQKACAVLSDKLVLTPEYADMFRSGRFVSAEPMRQARSTCGKIKGNGCRGKIKGVEYTLAEYLERIGLVCSR